MGPSLKSKRSRLGKICHQQCGPSSVPTQHTSGQPHLLPLTPFGPWSPKEGTINLNLDNHLPIAMAVYCDPWEIGPKKSQCQLSKLLQPG